MIKFNSICFYLEHFYYFCINKICSLKRLFDTKFQGTSTGTFNLRHFIQTTNSAGLEIDG